MPTLNTEEELIDQVIQGTYPDRTHYRPYVPRSMRMIINRAMNVDPSKRYQSAADFRLALEKLNLFCDWSWKPTRHGISYRTKIGGNKFNTLAEKKRNDRFDIITTKTTISGAVRRITKDCAFNLMVKDMKRQLHAILSRYVSEGK